MPIGLLFFAFVIGQAFWSYKLRRFFRIFPGLFAGLLISFTTGCLLFMDGFRGDAVRLLTRIAGGERLANMISSGDTLGVLRLIMENEDARNFLLKILPDSAKHFAVVSVLICIVCAVVNAVWEKPGVFLEFFAYGYTLVAGIFTAMESTLLGALLGIAVGVLLGALGYKISRGWIIVSPNLVDVFVLLNLLILLLASPGTSGGGSWLNLLLLAGLIAIPIGVYKQFKATAIPKDGVAQPAAAQSTLKSLWDSGAARVKAALARPTGSAPKADPSSGKPPFASGQKFCPQCGSSLNPGAKFCPKCGHLTKN